jgi:hypothetical protein
MAWSNADETVWGGIEWPTWDCDDPDAAAKYCAEILDRHPDALCILAQEMLAASAEIAADRLKIEAPEQDREKSWSPRELLQRGRIYEDGISLYVTWIENRSCGCHPKYEERSADAFIEWGEIAAYIRNRCKSTTGGP